MLNDEKIVSFINEPDPIEPETEIVFEVRVLFHQLRQ